MFGGIRLLRSTVGHGCGVFLLCGLFFGMASAGQDSAPSVLDASRPGSASVSLTEHFAVLEDPSRTLTLDDVRNGSAAARFKSGQSPGRSLNFGVTESAYWLRLTLANTSDRQVESMLEISYPRLAASVQVHQPNGLHGYSTTDTGYLKPFAERPYKHHFYVFPVSLPAQANQVVYLRFQSPNNLEIPARLWNRDAFHAYERADYMSQAVYFGMVLAMVMFNLLLFIALRDSNYLLYVVFVCTAALTFAANNGLAIEYLWGNSPGWVNIAHTVGYSVTLVFLLLFMRRMVATQLLVPGLDRLLKLFIGLHALMPLGLAISFNHFVKPALFSFALTAVLILVTGVVCALKRDRGALFFLAAFGLMSLAGMASALRALGVLPTNVITTEGVQFGSAVEMLVLAFALADRYNVLRRERAKAQHEALQAQTEAVQAEQRVVEALRTSERRLEARVSERSAELSATITRLKQTQADLVQADKLASLGALVAGVAHELNTPIGNALTTASTLESSAKDFQAVMNRGEMRKSTLTYFVESMVPMADLIGRSCRRAAALIASFKQVAVDQTSEQRRSFELRAMVEDNIAALRPSFRHAPWVIEVAVPSGIQCDSYPGPLGQVIANLIQNAVAHAFDGRDQGRLSVTAKREADRVEMVFEDDGKGMEAAVLAQIFEPFYTTRAEQGSSGLGLSISLNIVTGVLGGTLQATSQAGSGARFSLSFPLTAPTQPLRSGDA